MSLNFNYHKINGLFIQKIIEKIEERNILMHSRSVIIEFNSFKNFILIVFKKSENLNEMNELIKQ